MEILGYVNTLHDIALAFLRAHSSLSQLMTTVLDRRLAGQDFEHVDLIIGSRWSV